MNVEQFAKELKLSPELLLEQLKSAGVHKTAADDDVTEADKTQLLDYLRRMHGAEEKPKTKITLTRKQTTEIKKHACCSWFLSPTTSSAMLLSVAALLSISSMAVSGAFVPDFRVRSDDYTGLMAADAQRPPELKPFQAGAHGKFHVTGWTRPEQVLEWEITVPEDDAYSINVLLRRHGSQALHVELTGATQTVGGLAPASLGGWIRRRSMAYCDCRPANNGLC